MLENGDQKTEVKVVDSRNFRRYRKEKDFQLKLSTGSYQCRHLDYSFQGICLQILDDTFSLTPGDAVAFSMRDPDMDFQGEVSWINEAEQGQTVFFKRTGTLKGDCRDFRLADILIGLQRSMRTGLLLIVEGDKLSTIYLSNGDYIFATSSRKDDRLGEFLLKRGKITLPQFFEASQRLKKTGERLGNILVELGYLQTEDLNDVIKLQVESIILNAFDIEFGSFQFREGTLPVDETVMLNLSAANLIYRGVRSIMNIVTILEDLPSLEGVVRLSDNPTDIFQDIALDDVGKKIVSLAKSDKTIEEILSTFPEEEYFEAVKTLYALVCARVIVITEEEAPQETIPEDVIPETHEAVDPGFVDALNELHGTYRTMNYYDILGVQQEATEEEIKKAYWYRSKEFHPDKNYAHQEEDIKEKLSDIYAHINSVYGVLSLPEMRRLYDESLQKTPEEPEQAPEETASPEPEKTPEETDSKVSIALKLFNEGMAEMDTVRVYKEMESANPKDLKAGLVKVLKLFHEAISFDNTNPEYHYQFAVALSIGGLYKQAITALNKAIELDVTNAQYFAELGHILINLGFHHRAQSAFGRALRIDPRNARALEGKKISDKRQ